MFNLILNEGKKTMNELPTLSNYLYIIILKKIWKANINFNKKMQVYL